MAGKPKIPPEQWPGIVQRYLAGEQIEALSREFGVGRDAFYKIIRRSGHTVEKRGGAPDTPPEVAAEIIAKYKDGAGASALAKTYGVDKRTVYNLLNRAGIGTRPRSARVTGDLAVRQRPAFVPKGHKRGSRVPFREDAFAVLDDAVAYWLGYLVTDGCVSIDVYAGKSPRLILVQSRAHRCACERLRDFLGCVNPVEDYENVTFGELRPFSRLQVSSPRLCNDLLKWGIGPAKTGTVGVHPTLKDNPHFWRGVIDGDGSSYTDQIRCNSSSPRIVNNFRRYCMRNGLDKPTYSLNEQNVVMVILCGDRGRKIARMLYDHGDYIERLDDKYQRAMTYINKKPRV